MPGDGDQDQNRRGFKLIPSQRQVDGRQQEAIFDQRRKLVLRENGKLDIHLRGEEDLGEIVRIDGLYR